MDADTLPPPIDCHVHVFDPARFPYAADAWYQPVAAETATAVQLGHVLDAQGIGQALIVGPNSGYEHDNRCLLDALARGRGRYRGVAVVPDDMDTPGLAALQAAGVAGIAFNPALHGVAHYRGVAGLLDRMAALGLWAQFQVQNDQLLALMPLVDACRAPLVFDHCGRPDPGAGVDQPGVRALLALGRRGRAHVKLSSLSKCSRLPFPHEDAWPFVRALVEAFGPERLVWASDWPFLRAAARTDYGPQLALFRQLVPDASAQRAILVETPRRLFGFEAWPRAGIN